MLDRRPLYDQVRAALVQRLISGQWKPGDVLPSELLLATELSVSQGTVRKALDQMVREGMLVRRQGRGTFVAEPDDQNVVFKFFRLAREDGAQAAPKARVIGIRSADPNMAEADGFDTDLGKRLIMIERVRLLDSDPVAFERLYVNADRIPSLLKTSDESAMGNLYHYYSLHHGITVLRASEKLTVEIAGPDVADHLSVTPDAHILCVRRIAFDLEQQPVELRRSHFKTGDYHYEVQIE